MKLRNMALLASLLGSAAIGMPGACSTTGQAATAPKPVISEDAGAAIARMGAALRSKEFSFRVRTIRVYENDNGELLHIGHSFKVAVRRPDRLLVDGTGDDGPRELIYDGKTAVVALDNGKQYASIPVPATIEGMLHVIVGHFVNQALIDLITKF